MAFAVAGKTVQTGESGNAEKSEDRCEDIREDGDLFRFLDQQAICRDEFAVEVPVKIFLWSKFMNLPYAEQALQ